MHHIARTCGTPTASTTLANHLRRAACGVAVLALAGCWGGGSGDDGGGGSTTPPATEYTLTLTVGAGGSVHVASPAQDCAAGQTCSVNAGAGTQLVLDATAADGQRFSGWSGACSGSAARCVVTMDQARGVGAGFEAVPPASASWGAVTTVSGDGASVPVVAIDAQGRAIAAWRQLEPNSVATSHVWISRSTGGDAWSTPQRLDGDNDNASDLWLAVDPSTGQGVLAWLQLNGAQGIHLWARTVDANGQWSPALRIDTAGGMVGQARVGIDAQGHAFAVWAQIAPATRWSVFASRFDAASGWSAPAALESNEAIGSQDLGPELAVTPAGEALVVWQRTDLTRSGLWGSRYAAGAWGSAAEVVADAGALQTLGGYAVALDDQGNGLLAWGQLDVANGGARSTLMARRLAAGTWQDGAAVAPAVADGSFVPTPTASVNAAGGAVVGWSQSDGRWLAAVAPAGAGFGSATTVHGATTKSPVSMPGQGIDGGGEVLVGWHDPDQNEVRVQRRDAAGTWTGASVQSTPAGAAIAGSALAVNARGDAVLAWQQLLTGRGTQVALRRYSAAR